MINKIKFWRKELPIRIRSLCHRKNPYSRIKQLELERAFWKERVLKLEELLLEELLEDEG